MRLDGVAQGDVARHAVAVATADAGALEGAGLDAASHYADYIYRRLTQ